MAINFTDSPADGATQVIGGRTYTYNSAKNKWDTTATEVVGPTAKTYATVNDLPGTALTGDQAFVSGTNRLYIWNGSGWYNIALVNSTPTWTTQPDSSYTLASDGTATTITIVATDPEGLPITYSIASDTSGNIATVTQGTGLQENTWTITPSTSDADAGTFSLTFRASDGVNVASAISEFTLQFKVQNSNYTTALITPVGTNNQVNNTFVDSSTNSHTITAAGNATQTTFSPYRPGGYSTYFTGSGNYLTLPNDTSLQMGTSEFTIEFWMYCPNTTFYNNSGYYPTIISLGQYNAGVNIRFHDGGDFFEVYINNTNYTYTTTVPENEWAHIALIRDSSNDIKFFLNGTQIGNTNTNAANIAGTTNRIGSPIHNTLETYYGYLTDLRIVKGTAVYTSAFTPSTERLTAITNTSLLTCHLPYIADGSTNGHAITINGNTKTEPFAPYDYETYSAADNGGSMYFDGSGDYLHMPQTSLDLGSDNFCVEAWVYTTSTANQAIVGSYRYADGVGSWNLNVNYNSNKVRFFIRHSGGTVIDGQFESGTFPTNQWVHVAVTRDGANLRAFINGIQAGSTNTSLGSSSIDNAVTTYRIGASNDNNIYCNGNIEDVRVVRGAAVYTADFTPPTAPLTAITNTSLLLKGTNAGIIDKSQSVKTITLSGDVKSSTTQSKYLTSSMYFDGTGDYLNTSSSSILAFGSRDFTFESFIYATSLSQSLYPTFISNWTGTWAANKWSVHAGHNSYGNKALFYCYNADSANPLLEGTTTLAIDTWYHIAVTRSGNTFRLFVNGVLEDSNTSFTGSIDGGTSELVYAPSPVSDNDFQGYLSDLRITKGLARYTANFTPPTAALQG